MQINVDSNTNPIPADVLAPKPFSYASGGTAGGGITKAEMIEVMTAFGNALAAEMTSQRQALEIVLNAINDNLAQVLTKLASIEGNTANLNAPNNLQGTVKVHIE